MVGNTGRVGRLAALLMVLALVAGACGGGGDDEEVTSGPADDGGDDASDSDDAGDSAPEGTAALAEAIRIDAAVDARVADATEFVGVTDPVPVAVGDNVRTDGTGFAEIAYFDGSVTRLDVHTEFEVVDLVDAPGEAVIRTRMGVGRTWHRVQELTGNDTYEVETSVATAVVRGTAFIIVCPSDFGCLFTVLEGSVELILSDGTVVTLEAGEQLEITLESVVDGVGDPSPLGRDPFTDGWLVRNNDLDQTAGNDDLGEQFAATGPRFDPDGETVVWDLAMTLTSWDNGGDRFGPEIGHVTDPGTLQLRITCFDNRCAATARVGGAGWATFLNLQPAGGGGLRGEQVTDMHCSTDLVGSETLTVDLAVDPAAGTVTGEVVRTSSPLESEGGCRFSSETRSVTGSVSQRGTCIEVGHPEDCLPFQVGEDRPSHFDRPAEWL